MNATTPQRVSLMELLGNYYPGQFLGDTAPASTMCSECKNGGFHPDELHEGICGDCGKLPARCVACGCETQRRELNADLLCSDHHEAA